MEASFKKQPAGYATKAIHVGQDPDQWSYKNVVPAISLSTTFKQQAPGVYKEFDYSRSGNPTRKVLETCMAALDNAEYGLTFASCLGAATTIFTMLSNGDHIIVGDDLYGGTTRLISQVIVRLGIESTFVDPTDLKQIKSAFKPNTKLIWIETPSNPLMKVVDIEELSKLAHAQGNIIVTVDNTFLTSYFQRPLELGADLVVYSLSKYMNGHTDVCMGGITTNSQDLYDRLKFLQNATGIVPSPFDCYQVNRGLKTLALRMEQHQKNAIAVAKFLESHSFVAKVLHPALPSHPQHKIALKQSYGHSGIFSIYLKGGLRQAEAFGKAVQIFLLAGSLGGYQSSIALPFLMTHAAVPVEIRQKLGITDSLIRISVGVEDVVDLIADLKNALDVAQKA